MIADCGLFNAGRPSSLGPFSQSWEKASRPAPSPSIGRGAAAGRGEGGSVGRAQTAAAFALVLLLYATSAHAAQPTAKQILEKAAVHYDAIKDYTADARLTVESPSVHVPEMQVKMYYKRPDKLHVESKDGFAVLPRQGLIVGNPLRELMAGFELSLDRSERVLNNDCYVIKSSFQREGRAVQSTVWIDKKHWLVRQMHANPEWGPSVKVKLWYTRVGLRYWLPSTTAAQISLPPLPGAEAESESKPGEPTIVTIKFADYQVNTGLSDKIFEKQERGR